MILLFIFKLYKIQLCPLKLKANFRQNAPKSNMFIDRVDIEIIKADVAKCGYGVKLC